MANLTAAEVAYIEQVYNETGQASLKKTLDQFSTAMVKDLNEQQSFGRIPAGVTITQYLDTMYPKAKRVAFKANVIKLEPVRAELERKAADTILAVEFKKEDARKVAVEIQKAIEEEANEALKPFVLRKANLKWEIPVVIVILAAGGFAIWKITKAK